MSYIAITLNHMRAVKAWADRTGASADLDLRTFELEVKARNRYYKLRPRFLGQQDGRLFHVSSLVDNATGFIGWLPYDILRWEVGEDKLVVKKLLQDAGVRVPAAWQTDAPPQGYILKRSVGSFGLQITGPYRPGATDVRHPPENGGPNKGSLFAEQFIEGAILKVWYWGDKVFFAHRDDWPSLEGDGKSNVQELLSRRLAEAGLELEALPDRHLLQACLAYQGATTGHVPAQGTKLWIDFRYGRTYASQPAGAGSDDKLGVLEPGVRAQLDKMGQVMGAQLHKRFGAPVLYAVDGVCDAEGRVWWLEMNTSPILPPDGYELMFATLFGGEGA